MVFQAPMQLRHNNEPFGTITTYSYETPWATGHLVAHNKDLHDRCLAICSFIQWILETDSDNLSEEDSDKLYDHELASQKLTEADIHWYDTAEWTIVTSNGEEHSAYSLSFSTNNLIEWRW
jgi:hypothetical protein